MSDKLRLDPSQLTMADLRRARVALGGRNPWELLEDSIEAVVLMIFCLRSRDDPEFTLDDAAQVPLADFELAEDDSAPPPTASPAEPGETRGSGEPTTSAAKPPKRTPTSSSESSSASPEPSTTP